MKKLLKGLTILVSTVALLLLAIRAFLWIAYIDAKESTPSSSSGTVDFSSESWLNLPIAIKLDDVQALANEKAPRNLHERRGEEFTHLLREDWIEYNINRGEIALSPSQGRLAFKAPVSGSLSAGGQMDPVGGLFGIRIGRGIGVRETCNFSGTLHGSVGVRLKPDWTIAPDLRIDLDVAEANIRLLNSINISVRGKIREAFQRAIPGVQAQLANQMLSQLKLQEQAHDAWLRLHLKRQIASSPASWVTVRPLAIAARNISVSDDRQIIGGFGLRCSLSGIVGSEPPSIAPTALPSLSVLENLPTDFHIELPVMIAPDKVSDSLKEQFNNKPLQVDKHRLTLSDPEIVVVGSRIQLRTLVEAASGFFARRLKGTVTLEGTPALDVASKTLFLTELHYTVATKDALTKTAAWLLDPAVIGELRKRCHYSFAKDIERANSAISTSLPVLLMDSKLEVSATVRDIAAKSLRLEAGQIFVVATADGSASLAVKP